MLHVYIKLYSYTVYEACIHTHIDGRPYSVMLARSYTYNCIHAPISWAHYIQIPKPFKRKSVQINIILRCTCCDGVQALADLS